MPKDLKVKHKEPLAEAGPDPTIIPAGNNLNSTQALSPAGDKPPVNHIPPEACRECLAAMTHRLVQPLTALRGGLELGLLGKPSESEYRALLQQSLELADSLTQMIVSLRNLGESGVSLGPSHHLSLGASVQQAIGGVGGWAQSRDIALRFTAQGTITIRANPERLSEALQSLFAWTIQNSGVGSTITLDLSTSGGDAQLLLSLPKMDWHFEQAKNLEELTIPGVLFSQAAKAGTLGWAVNQRLFAGLGGKLEILSVEGNTGCIRAQLPLAPPS